MSKVKTLEEMDDMKGTWRFAMMTCDDKEPTNVYLLEDNSCCDMLQAIDIVVVQIIFVDQGPNFRPVQGPNLNNNSPELALCN